MAVVDVIAYNLARIPIRAYRVTSKGARPRRFLEIQDATAHGQKAHVIRDMIRTGELEETDHPVLKLIHEPMGYDRFDALDGMQWRVVAQQMLELSGNAYILFEGGGTDALTGPPSEMLPIPDSWVKRREGSKRFDITSTEENIEWDNIHPSRLHWIRKPRPANPFGRGTGLAQVLSDEIDADEAAAQFLSSILNHNGVPALLIQVEDSTPEQRAQMMIDLNNRFRGPRKAGQTLVSSGKVDVKDVGASPTNLQLVEERDHFWKTTRETAGVPPEQLGVVEDSNRATIRESDRIMGKNVLEPRCAIWDGYYTNRLVRLWPDGENIIVAHDSAIPKDEDLEATDRGSAPFALRMGEWRVRCGEKPTGTAIDDMFVINGVPMTEAQVLQLASYTVEAAKPQPVQPASSDKPSK